MFGLTLDLKRLSSRSHGCLHVFCDMTNAAMGVEVNLPLQRSHRPSSADFLRVSWLRRSGELCSDDIWFAQPTSKQKQHSEVISGKKSKEDNADYSIQFNLFI
ncbi:hypothetical protein ILYODFUR_008447 [Ilyodon furcidens]|uniref:Uncharacterized protein n=1 Tax=Ilyodon furcidens TaxID=33524 RepID=A0ABV0UED8_9TELE